MYCITTEHIQKMEGKQAKRENGDGIVCGTLRAVMKIWIGSTNISLKPSVLFQILLLLVSLVSIS